MPSSAGEPQALLRSTDNVMAAFLTFLAEEQVSARTARLYPGHLGRFAGWLREHYRADLLEATSHDVREYHARLAGQQKPASVNAALAALQRFYGWARETGWAKANPTAKLKRSRPSLWHPRASPLSNANGSVVKLNAPGPWWMPS